jgi:DNA (cytosine-5)-methyltransferase 1
MIMLQTRNGFLQHLSELPKPTEQQYRFSAISLFCGGGGLDLGLSFAGFESKFATDVERPHCETIAYNFPHTVTLPKDVKELTGEHIREITQTNEYDLLAGGPPCQAFSILGRRNSLQDPRGQLVFEYVRLVTEIQPRAFIFENVPGLLTLNKGEDWRQLLAFFESETRYKLYIQILNSADFGVPQIRKRVFIVGFRSHHTQFEFPMPQYRQPESRDLFTNRELPTWLPAYLALEDVDGLPNHDIRIHGERVRNRYDQIPPGGRDPIDHTDRIHPNRPSGTVLVGSRAGGGRPHIHPFEPRHITVREAARLQSFPDWYIFQSTNTWQYRAVGNAVPPLLAKAVGEQISIALENWRE